MLEVLYVGGVVASYISELTVAHDIHGRGVRTGI